MTRVTTTATEDAMRHAMQTIVMRPMAFDIEAQVIKDIARRQQMGIAKYGSTVADNDLPLREWLNHQYEELLDAAIYCRRAIQEIDKNTVDSEEDAE